MKPADHSGGQVSRMTGTAVCWVRWPCIAPSVHSPENYVRGACVPVPPADVRAITQSLPRASPGPAGAEPALAGTRPTRSPEWPEDAEGAADADEKVPRGAEAFGVCRCTPLAPWAAVRGLEAGWPYCRALPNLHLGTTGCSRSRGRAGR